MSGFLAAVTVMKERNRRDRAWWALNDPVAYLWLRRAEARGAVVPWSKEGGRQ